MLEKGFSIIFTFIFTVTISCGQNKMTEPTYVTIDTKSALSQVYGWRHNDNNKWTVKLNKIKDIDYFKDYIITSFSCDNKKYISITKRMINGNNQFVHIYIIDYKEYIENTLNWKDHTILQFPILKEYYIELKKDQDFFFENLDLEKNNLDFYPKDYLVFQYQFQNDQTVKFLFYTLYNTENKYKVKGLEMNQEKSISIISSAIGSDLLFSSFFYKTTSKDFDNFIDSPIWGYTANY